MPGKKDQETMEQDDKKVQEELTQYIGSLKGSAKGMDGKVHTISTSENVNVDHHYEEFVDSIPATLGAWGLSKLNWNWNNYASGLLNQVPYKKIEEKVTLYNEQMKKFYDYEKEAKDRIKAYFCARKIYTELCYCHAIRLINFNIIECIYMVYDNQDFAASTDSVGDKIKDGVVKLGGQAKEGVRKILVGPSDGPENTDPGDWQRLYRRFEGRKETLKKIIEGNQKFMDSSDNRVENILAKPPSEWKSPLEKHGKQWKICLSGINTLVRNVEFNLERKVEGEDELFASKPLKDESSNEGGLLGAAKNAITGAVEGATEQVKAGAETVVGMVKEGLGLPSGTDASEPITQQQWEEFKKKKAQELSDTEKTYASMCENYDQLKNRYDGIKEKLPKEYKEQWENITGAIETLKKQIDGKLKRFKELHDGAIKQEDLNSSRDELEKLVAELKTLIDAFCKKIVTGSKESDEKGLSDLVDDLKEIATKVSNGEEVPIPIVESSPHAAEKKDFPKEDENKNLGEDKKEPSKADEKETPQEDKKETPNNGESDLGKSKVQEKEDAKNTSEPKEQQAPKVNDQELEDIKLFLNELNGSDKKKDFNIDVTYNALSSPNILRRLQNITNKNVKTQLENKFKQFKQYMAQEISEFSRQVSVADYVSQEDLMKIDDNLKGTEVGKGLKALAEKIKKLEDTKARRLHQDVPKENKKAEKDYRVSAIRMFIDKYEHRLKKYQDPKDKKVFIPQEKGAKTPKEAATKEFINALRDARLLLYGLDITKKSEIVNVWKGLQSRDGIDKFIDGLKKDSHCKGKTEEMLYTLYGILHLYETEKIKANSDNLNLQFNKIKKRFDGLSGFAMRLGGATIYALREQFKSLITFLYFFLHDCKIKEIKNNDSSAET